MDLLQKFYVNERNIDRVEIWTSHQPEHVANVSVICYNERRATLKQVEYMAKEMHRGNLNISSGQQVSDISDIFNPNRSQDKDIPCTTPNVILIEGVPGIGKTILSREIAFQWACKGLLSNTMLLFLVHLRDLQIPQITSLQQLVCYATKLPSNNKMVKAAVDYMENKSGENCTMVFDGYDEISEMVRKDSLVAKIIRRDILQLCRLVITSRPSASTDLHRIIDRRVEVLGFTKDDRNEYIRKNLQENEAEIFQKYLQNSPFISDLCYIPLNMTKLLNLFKELASPDSPALPKTQTDINNQFIYKTISHFISQKKKKTVTIKSPDDLQMPYKQYFTALCKLAFDLLGNEMVAFSDADIQKYISKKSITNWSTVSLGLLREANYYSIEENKSKISYSYLHLSMQECLAAHYIAKEAENNFLKKYFWDPRYLNVGAMYIGLTKGKSIAFKNFISSHSGTFGRQFGADKVTVNDKVKKLHFFHCLLEVENNELSEQLQVDEILHDNIIDLSDHVLQHKDIHTLGFFLSRSTIKHWEKLDLSNSYINDEGLEDFSKFCDSKVTNVSIDTIDLSHNNLSSSSVDAIINLISCFKVKDTIIADSIAESQTFKVALLSIVTKVEKVTISSTGEDSRFLINYELNDMDQNFLGELEYKRRLYAWNANALLSIHTLIKYCSIINIYEQNLADEKIANIASELKMISEETGNKIMYSLQSANKIIAYGVEFYQISQSLMSNSFLMHNTNYKIVDLRQCRLEDKFLIELKQTFCTNQIECLETLIFSYCSLTASSFPMVLEILKCCVVKRLIISDNLICNKALCSLIFNEETVKNNVLNCKINIPLTFSINGIKCIFFTNFSDAIISDYDCINSQLYFSNIGLNKVNVQSFLMLCRNNKLQVNLFELNIADDIITDVLTELEPFKDNTYVLASSTRLIAFNAKHKQIMEAVPSSSKITTLKLINCEISLSKLYPLGKLLSNSSHNWDLIDLSGCNIKDEGCLSLYEHLTATKNQIHIGVLNLSSNYLESNSVIYTLKIFENCVIKTLIVSWNDIAALEFSEALKGHLLAKKQFLNFKYEIPLLVYESKPSYELCSVYAFQTSDIVFSSKPYKGNTLYNLYHVQCAHKYFFNHIFKILLTSDQIKVSVLAEGVMNEKVCSMVTKLVKLKYDKCDKLPKVDFSSIHITDQSCKLICDALLSEKSSVKVIEELDFSSHHFSLTCAPMIMESFQYCVIKHLVLPSREVLDKISETILKDYHAGKTIVNFTEKIPLTVNIETEFEEEGEDGITYSIVANTYLQDYKITVELFNHYEDVVINQITTSHAFILLDCLIKNKLDTILSILYTKATYIKICILELKLTNDVLDATVDHLRMLKKEIYRDRLRYVLASDSKIVAYNAKRFQILQALQIKPRIYDLEITHCFMSKDNLRLIALTLIGKFNLLKNIKVIACKIKDGDFFSFCDILSNYPKTSSIILKTMDFSHNLLTPSSIGTILKLLQCSVIEKLILSNNSINDTTLTDAVYQLARYKWSEICNVSLGIPLVIINMPSSRHCKLSTNRVRCATIFHMNCEIDKSLLLEYCSQAKKIYFLKSIVAIGDLRMNLSILYHCLSTAIKTVVYEIDLNDDVVEEAAACLRKEGYIHINFILASRTKLLASNSSYHQIAPLLENNLLINNLQLKNFAMSFPYDCRFTRTIRNTSRTWELIDLSGCNIRDNGCLRLQECFVALPCTITHLNLMYNNLSSASAAAVANTILKCDIKMVNISSNTLQHDQVINALSCLKQNSATALSVELISGDSAAIIVSNTDPKLLPYHLWSSNYKIQLCVMHHFQVNYIDCILSSLLNDHTELSKVILQNNGLTFQQLECIINKLSAMNICIQEAHIQYNSRFTDYSSASLMNNLVEIARDDSNLSPFSSLTFSKLDLKYNKICTYDNKIMPDSVENILTKLIQWQYSTRLVAIKLLNCYVTSNTAMKFASLINELTHLKLFELSHSHIQESDLKVILIALQSIRSLNFFAIKSIDCFIKDSAEDIASVINVNTSIMHLEISHCDMKQSAVLKITKSLKELSELKQLNLSGIALTCESLDFALEDKCTLKELNLSNCKLQKPEIVKISSALERARLSSINLSHNNISDYAANRLASLLLNQSIGNVDMSDCNLQEEGMSCIINALKYKSLKSLNFCGNRITDFLASEISAGISNNPYIMNLDLSNCNLQEIGTEEILTSLKSHIFYLTAFKISSIVSTEETISLFGAILDNNKGIENLTLQNCNCERIFNAIRKKVSTLQLLDINSSVISFKNMISIVVNNTNIKHLNISNCDVQGEFGVTKNDLSGLFLEYLNLGGNMITKVFADFISNLITANYKLKHLDIANCEVKEAELMKIINSMKLLTSLNYLNCSKLVISTQVACILSQVIANNVHLEHLDISFCYLNEQTFLPIASALKQLRLLKHFIIHSNYITLDETRILSGNSSDKMLVTDDYDTISLAASELIPSCSSDRKSPIPVNQYNKILQEANRIGEPVNSDMDGYDTISMAMGEAVYSIIPQNFELPSPSNCNKSAKADDHDTISLATGEITMACYSNIHERSEVTDIKSTNTAHYSAIHMTPDERALHCSSIYEDVISTDKPLKSHNSKNSCAGDVDSMYMTTATGEMTPPYCTIPVASNEISSETTSTDGGDHKEMLTVTGDIMPPCSSNVYDNSDPSSTDVQDYDAMSIAPHVATLQFPDNDCSSNDSVSPVKDELSQSYHHSSVDEDDYDTISIVDSETTSQHSDRMSENASRKVTDILAATTTESDRSLESPLHDHDYDTVSTDDNTSYLHNKNSENVLQDDYEDVLIATHNLMTKHNYCDENASTVVYETVPTVSDTISSVSIIQRIPGKAASPELISVQDRLGNTSQDFYENVVGEATRSYSPDKTSDYQNIFSLSESTTTDQYEDTLLKNDSTTTEYYSTKILENTISDGYKDIHYSLTEAAVLDCDKNTSLGLPVTINEISEVINCNHFLECFDISDCKLSEFQIATVATALSETSTLKHLYLSQSTIATNNTALKVASVITSNLSLENINLSDCHLQESGIKIITGALATLSSLVSIDLSENKITYNSMPSVAAAIRENSLLQLLNISHCIEYNEEFKSATKQEGVNNILMPLTMLTCLKHLNLHSNYVNDVTSKLLPVVISSNKSLSHLDFTNCKLTNTRLVAIGKKLQATFTLKYLSLSSNIITNEAAYEIALAVSNNLSLQHLALSDCKMEERALMDIAESLLNISSLKHLDLSYSIITDKVAPTLASSISNNTLLAFLDLKHCVWEKTGFARIHKVFCKLPMLKEVDTR